MQYDMLWGTRLCNKVFGGEAEEMSTETFTVIWLFNLWMAYRVLQSKTWRVYVTCLYVLSMVCRIADALVGGGISWR